uniref:C25 family cysteine peptidase n=1 Tax=Lentimicrobium sp. TaxID=2034841 RepID=UPI00345E80E6
MKKSLTIQLPGIILFMIIAGTVSAQHFSYPDAWDKQGFSLQANHRDFVEVNYSINSFSLENLTVEGKIMKDISLPGSFLFNNEGAPDLPGNGKFLAIPQGSIPSLEIISSRTEVMHNVEIAPAPRIPKDDENIPLQYAENKEIYSTDAFYPAQPVIISNTLKIRGVDAVMLGITPFQYNPVTKELVIYRDLKVKITFSGGNGHFGDDRLRSRWWDPILEDALFNRSSLPAIDYNRNTTTGGPTEDTGAEYLIITPNGADFVQWADSIKKFRTEQGISTLIRTLSQVGGNTTTAIETYINNAYNTWTIPPAAVLLLGDYGTDAANSVISPVYDSYCVSDNIYGDVDGDHLPEITMARITANNAAQLAVMVTKFLNYERNPPTSADFYDHPVTALGWQTERWFQICSETVGGFWKNELGKNPVRINEVYDGNPSSDPWSTATNTSTVVNYFGPSGLGYIPSSPQTLGNWAGGNATDINNAINSGAFMLQHRDHGMETGWGEPYYVSSNINGLVNTDLTYIMSINCLTGKYNYSSECFAEKFHRYTYDGNNAGALGIMAASEVSYSFVNDTYVWGMYDNMWPEFMPAEGTTPASRGILPAFGNSAGKIFLAQSNWPYNTGNKEVTYNLFHHHGDAFLTVYSEVPQYLSVAHNPVLFAGANSFSVMADAGSLIALTVNGEIIGTGTGTGSLLSILIPPQVPPSQMVVTVTKQNFFRYRALVDVIPAEGPYVVYNDVEISDPLPGGNNNGNVDYGEDILLSVALRNVGIETALNVVADLSTANSYISIIDNSAVYGNINPNETITVAGGYMLQVADNIPDQEVVAFTVSATDGTDTWNSNFNITANAPLLTIGAMTVTDNGPGCNNDGIL